MQTKEKKRKKYDMHRHRSLAEEALISEKMQLLHDFCIVNQFNHKKYREKFESALANRPAGVSAVAVIENLSITIIEEEL